MPAPGALSKAGKPDQLLVFKVNYITKYAEMACKLASERARSAGNFLSLSVGWSILEIGRVERRKADEQMVWLCWDGLQIRKRLCEFAGLAAR